MTRPKTIKIRLPEGIVEAADQGDANLSDADEAYWEQAAEEVLESASRPLPEHLKTPGRPSLSGGEGVSPAVSFRLPKKQREAAEALARERGLTLSQLARQLLEREVDQSA
jgi:predicted DNA-binding protein